MQIGIKEELIKLIQNIPDDFVYEVIEIIQQISRREEAWDEFFSLEGVGESGLLDVSEEKHKYLAEALRSEF